MYHPARTRAEGLLQQLVASAQTRQQNVEPTAGQAIQRAYKALKMPHAGV